MSREPAWRRYLRFWGPDARSDVDDELQFHLQTKIEHLEAAGMPPGQARREALRQFGPVSPVREECRTIGHGRQQKASRAEYFAGWFRDFSYTVRLLSRTKGLTVAIIFILALGIGANTAVFTLLDRLLFRPLPVPQPSHLLLVSKSSLDASGRRSGNRYFSLDGFVYLRDHNQAFSGLAAEAFYVGREHRLHERIERPAEATPVSGNFFEVLGKPALLGRALTPSDDVRSAASHVAVAVLPLSSASKAHQLSEEGKVYGKIVLRVA